MEFSPQQQEAIQSIRQWNGKGHPVYRLFGYAGTGKTTLAKYIADSVTTGPVIFAAYTGKAAHVLNNKGCHGARTVHSLIYLPKGKSAEKLRGLSQQLEAETDPDRKRELQALWKAERENLQRPSFSLKSDSELRDAALLILDECSMVDERMAEDILSFGCPVLALGDPAQLPPVKGTGYFTDAEPDFLLTEVHRQAGDSPILTMATNIRQGILPMYGGPEDAQVVTYGTFGAKEMYHNFDQIICGRNKTRREINRRIREYRMFQDALPEVGDRIVCLRNSPNTGLLNGSQWDVCGVDLIDDDYIDLTIAEAGSEEYTFTVRAHTHFFTGTEDQIPHYDMKNGECFDYAYAMTCHKSQGSQWDRVAVVNESGCFGNNSRRWLYTAVTRAAEKVAVIQ